MTAKPSTVKKLKAAAAKSAAQAAAAKRQVRLAKAGLKQARKAFKAAKKAAKQARRQVEAAGTARPPRPAATLKLKPAIRKSPSAPKFVPAPKSGRTRKALAARKTVPARKTAQAKAAPTGVAPKRSVKKTVVRRVSTARAPKAPHMRSAAEIAKTVIDRLHAPPPILPPAPIIPPDTGPISEGSTPEAPGKT